MQNPELDKEVNIKIASREVKSKGLEGIDMVKDLKHFFEVKIGRVPVPLPEGLDYEVYETASILLSVVEYILEDPVAIKNNPYDHYSIKCLLNCALRNINLELSTEEESKNYRVLEDKLKRKLKLKF